MPGQLRHRVVVGIAQAERFGLVRRHALELVVEARADWLGAPISTGTPSCFSLSPALPCFVERLALEIDDERVTLADRRRPRPARSGPRVRAAARAPDRRLRPRPSTGVRRTSIEENSPGSKDGTTSNSALKVSGCPSSSLRSRMSRRLDRLDAALLQRFAHGALDQLVRDVVQDLALEALLDHLRRHLARAEARDARRASRTSRRPLRFPHRPRRSGFRPRGSCAFR